MPKSIEWRGYQFFNSKSSQKTNLEKLLFLRKRAKKEISELAQLKLEWIIFYYTQANSSITFTASHFGITRKTFHKWLKRFKDKSLSGLEEDSRAPIHVRKRHISLEQRSRVRVLRKKYPKYGKMKLVYLYQKIYVEKVSSWKIQKIIEENNLYFDLYQAQKRRNRSFQARAHKKQRITNLKKEKKINYLWHADTVILTLSEGGYRYLLTAIDEVSKLSFARLYTSHSSRSAKDFLERLVYLTDKKVIHMHNDNGSEFKKEFEEALKILNIPQWYSRPHTPKDNPVLERFNRTIQEEFVDITDISLHDPEEFNIALTTWLIEYNSVRPHQTLDYRSPLEYLDDYYQVLPMYSSSTQS